MVLFKILGSEEVDSLEFEMTNFERKRGFYVFFFRFEPQNILNMLLRPTIFGNLLANFNNVNILKLKFCVVTIIKYAFKQLRLS